MIIKPLRPSPISTIVFFFLLIALSGCTITRVKHSQSSDPHLKLQQQIDILNRCMQPILTRHQAYLLQEAHNAEQEVKTDFSLTGLLKVSGLEIAKQRTLLYRWGLADESVEDFWNNLNKDKDPLLSKNELYELQLVLFLGRITQYRMPLLLQLNRLRTAEGLITLYSISKLSREQWTELFVESGVDLEPESFIRSVDKAFDDILYGGCN